VTIPACAERNFRRVLTFFLGELIVERFACWSLVTIFLGTSLASSAPVELAGKKPNIILVMTDDQGYGDLACHGNPHLKTPNLDRLHSQCVRFTDFHVSPTCSPTRAALLTGRHEFKSGVTHTVLERERLALDAVTFPQVLRSAGYTTGIFGKWHLGDEDAYQPDKRGFDKVFIHGCGGIGQTYLNSSGGDAPGNNYFNPVLRLDGKFVATKGYCTDVFFSNALQWIESVKGDKPFFCYIPTNTPHRPLVCPPGTDKPYKGKVPDDTAAFYGMIANIDDNVGKLLDRLDEWKIANNTLVVFLTDNGTASGAKVFNAGMRGAKGSPYRGGTRVPSFWRWPGTLKAGVDVDAFACHYDVFSTLAELAGAKLDAKATKQVEGRSLVPLLRDPKADWPDRKFVTHVGRWDKGKAAEGKFAKCCVREGRWTLVRMTPKAAWELYDIQADPAQEKDVAGDHAALVEKLSAWYDRWWDEVRPMFVNEDAVGPKVNPYHEAYWKQFDGPGPNNVPPPEK
jgi:arylsulfatase